MRWFTFTKSYQFSINSSRYPEIAARDALQKLKEQFLYADMDVSEESNSLYFSGNFLASPKGFSWLTRPLDYVNGDLEVAIQENQLTIKYSFFFLGQTLFTLTLLGVSWIASIQGATTPQFFLIAMTVGFIAILLTGYLMVDNIVREVGHSV